MQQQLAHPKRTSPETAELIAQTGKAVVLVGANVHSTEIGTSQMMNDIIAASPAVSLRRYPTILLGGFSALALGLVALGLYGVISYAVTQRTREIGVRMALGARTQVVQRQVAIDGMKLVGLGLAIGLLASAAVTRAMSSMLFGVVPYDAPTTVTVIVFLAMVGLSACYFPARRATRISPTEALRTE